jgi:hypothetical protein
MIVVVHFKYFQAICPVAGGQSRFTLGRVLEIIWREGNFFFLKIV